MTDAPSVLVTGAGRGLGLELCRIYLRLGWTVFPVVRAGGASELDAAGGGRCHRIVADVASDAAVAAIHDAVAARTDRLDVLVNNAGVPGSATELAELPPAEVGELLDVHCVGAVRCTQAVLPLLKAAGNPKVVNVTSRTASMTRNAAGEFAGESISYSYRIAKAAQNMLTLCMSEELGPSGVAVCALHPGEFESALNPDGPEPAAAAAARIVRFVDGAGPADGGRWHDPRTGQLPW